MRGKLEEASNALFNSIEIAHVFLVIKSFISQFYNDTWEVELLSPESLETTIREDDEIESFTNVQKMKPTLSAIETIIKEILEPSNETKNLVANAQEFLNQYSGIFQGAADVAESISRSSRKDKKAIGLTSPPPSFKYIPTHSVVTKGNKAVEQKSEISPVKLLKDVLDHRVVIENLHQINKDSNVNYKSLLVENLRKRSNWRPENGRVLSDIPRLESYFERSELDELKKQIKDEEEKFSTLLTSFSRLSELLFVYESLDEVRSEAEICKETVLTIAERIVALQDKFESKRQVAVIKDNQMFAALLLNVKVLLVRHIQQLEDNWGIDSHWFKAKHFFVQNSITQEDTKLGWWQRLSDQLPKSDQDLLILDSKSKETTSTQTQLDHYRPPLKDTSLNKELQSVYKYFKELQDSVKGTKEPDMIAAEIARILSSLENEWRKSIATEEGMGYTSLLFYAMNKIIYIRNDFMANLSNCFSSKWLLEPKDLLIGFNKDFQIPTWCRNQENLVLRQLEDEKELGNFLHGDSIFISAPTLFKLRNIFFSKEKLKVFAKRVDLNGRGYLIRVETDNSDNSKAKKLSGKCKRFLITEKSYKACDFLQSLKCRFEACEKEIEELDKLDCELENSLSKQIDHLRKFLHEIDDDYNAANYGDESLSTPLEMAEKLKTDLDERQKFGLSPIAFLDKGIKESTEENFLNSLEWASKYEGFQIKWLENSGLRKGENEDGELTDRCFVTKIVTKGPSVHEQSLQQKKIAQADHCLMHAVILSVSLCPITAFYSFKNDRLPIRYFDTQGSGRYFKD
ncbi:unnamed protein product, partial [Mesorhabditis belari]|uniref:Uncharacterized protein n=1 Tax=Mesorhabditis belari TaxID=2138241 RepID=A0AAF3JAQ1_9BILA